MITRHDRRSQDSVMHSWLPLYHDMGLIGGLLSCLQSHSSLWLRTPLWFLADPIGWLAELAREQVYAIAIPDFALGYTLKALRNMEHEEIAALDLRSIRAAYLGSEPISPAHLEDFITLLAPAGWRRDAFIPCYGMAEAVLMVSGVPVDEGYRIKTLMSGQSYVSLGRIFAEFSLRIVDEATRLPLKEGEIGEIQLRGGSLATGYLANSRPLLGADGYYTTGDLGFIDDGELFVTGRCGERLKINGQSYFLSDFDQAASSFATKHKFAAAAFASDRGVRIAIELRGLQTADVLDDLRVQLRDAVLQKLGIKLAPTDIVFVGRGGIPKTSSGKVKRAALREAY